MPALSRRALLATAAASAAAGLSGISPVRAGAPMATAQVPSAYRYKVGSFEVTAVSDGARTGPLSDTFVRNQPRDAVNAALKDAFLAQDQITIPFTALLVNTGSKLILIDTGNGPAQGTVGQLQANLKAAGVDPKSIDTVVISHFHGDHINGLLGADGKPAFPSAQVMVPQAEWAFWTDDAQMSRAPEAMKGAFQNVRRVFGGLGAAPEPYGWDKEILPGLTSVETAGHTPGHTSYVLASGTGRLFVQSDVTNIPSLFLRNPTWHVMYDMDPAKAEQTRRRVYDMVVADRLMVAGYHFPFPAAAHLEKDGDRFRYVPVAWSPVL
ncbi:MBL fold metallo-hydrolase [Roseixanthobacter pseudopolyaromaticivorans]|uniref:MBL fold metallo-hydrolase n=1 Tax=Xanthobacteraceae TaxID=335928 RepID=UPI003729F21D